MPNEDTKKQVRQLVDLVEIVGERLPLKQRGQNYIALCPFHQEKTPSFNVNPARQIFHCFGCGAGGDVFTFVMEMDKVSFPEALRTLAERSGVALPKGESSESSRRTGEVLDAIYQANSIACELYERSLKSSQSAAKAQDYLKDRGVTGQTAKRFRLGWAPPGWNTLLDSAKEQDFTPEILSKAGLVVQNERGGYYDRFRERLVFTITNASGRPVAFGARTLDPDGQPKYLNSSETDIYNKSKALYGLREASDAIRKEKRLLVVEGYMDVLRLSQEGIEAVVATCGTALTPEHGKTLGRYAENIIVVFDGDTAGVAAALKAGDTLLEGGVSPSVVLLPEGEDPDSFVSKNGPDALNLMVDKAQDFLAFKWDRSALEHGTDTVEGRHAVVADMLDSVALVGDDMKSRMHVHEIADRAAVDENLVLKALSRRKQGGRTRQEPSAEVPQESVGWRAPDWQKRMLALMLDQPDVCLEVDEIVGVDGFSDELGKRIAQKLIELSRTGDQPSATLVMGQDTDPRETRAVAELAQFTLGKTGLDEARKQIRRLRIESVDVEMSNLYARLYGLKSGSK